MLSHTTDTICALTGASLSNLRHWQRFGLIQFHPSDRFWTDGQLTEIRSVMRLSACGATAREIRLSRSEAKHVITYGWSARRGEMLIQLESGSDRQLSRFMRRLSRDFSGDDFVIRLMRPLCLWLRHDERTGSASRLSRFRELLEKHSTNVKRIALRTGSTPLLLEVSGSADEMDILLEVIRLTEQGFCVDVLQSASGQASEDKRRFYEHHLIWTEEGTVCVNRGPLNPRLALAV